MVLPTFKKNLLSLVTIRQAGHQVIMEDGLVKINSVKQNMQTMMIGYEDGKLLRMKGVNSQNETAFSVEFWVDIIAFSSIFKSFLIFYSREKFWFWCVLGNN
jgi:hypothetical protein